MANGTVEIAIAKAIWPYFMTLSIIAGPNFCHHNLRTICMRNVHGDVRGVWETWMFMYFCVQTMMCCWFIFWMNCSRCTAMDKALKTNISRTRRAVFDREKRRNYTLWHLSSNFITVLSPGPLGDYFSWTKTWGWNEREERNIINNNNSFGILLLFLLQR